jgi:hypothetical protein
MIFIVRRHPTIPVKNDEFDNKVGTKRVENLNGIRWM